MSFFSFHVDLTQYIYMLSLVSYVVKDGHVSLCLDVVNVTGRGGGGGVQLISCMW